MCWPGDRRLTRTIVLSWTGLSSQVATVVVTMLAKW